MTHHTFKLLAGPLDGLTLSAPIDAPIPSEICLREVHCRPFWEGLYQASPAAPMITEEWLESPAWAFRHVGTSEWWVHFQWLERRVATLEAEIRRLQGRPKRERRPPDAPPRRPLAPPHAP